MPTPADPQRAGLIAVPADPRVRRLRSLAYLLDSAIPVPGTSWRVGWDAVIGLVPGAGDVAGGLLSLYIVVQAARLGVARATLARMLGNVGLEVLVGAVPFVGDLFDAGWKANQRNLRLVDAHLREPVRAARAGRLWLGGVAAAAALLLMGVGAAAVWLVGALLRVLGIG